MALFDAFASQSGVITERSTLLVPEIAGLITKLRNIRLTVTSLICIGVHTYQRGSPRDKKQFIAGLLLLVTDIRLFVTNSKNLYVASVHIPKCGWSDR